MTSLTMRANQSRYNELVSKAILLLSHPEQVTEFELRRLERDAAALAKVDPAESYEVRALVATIVGDYAEADRFFELGLQRSTDRAITITNYLVALAAAARCEAVYDVVARHGDDFRHEPSSLRTATHMLAACGWIIVQDFVRRDADRLQKPIPPLFDVEDAESILRRHELQETDIAEAVHFAHSFLRRQNVSPEGIDVSIVSDELGEQVFYYQFGVKLEGEAAADIEWKMLEAMADKDLAADKVGALVVGLTAGGLENHGNLGQ